MENKETKKNNVEELNDEVLDEVSGGVFEVGDIVREISVDKVPKSKKTKTPGAITIPEVPVIGGPQKY